MVSLHIKLQKNNHNRDVVSALQDAWLLRAGGREWIGSSLASDRGVAGEFGHEHKLNGLVDV